MKLLHTDTLLEAQEKLKKATENKQLKTMRMKTEDALSYICAKDVYALEDVPSFRRSTVDGYALIASDTLGASESNPLFFDICGHIAIQEKSSITVSSMQTVQVETGSMIPDGANAVIMVEYCEEYIPGHLACFRSLSVGENITQIGEDVHKEHCLIKHGKKIDAYDIGMLVSQGITDIEVFCPLNLSIISTGDELIDFHEARHGAYMRDMNSHTLTSQANLYGMHVISSQLVKDTQKEIESIVRHAIEKSDIVIVSGGSSKGNKDYTALVFDRLTNNVLTHGISIKPGKPTVIAYEENHQCLCIGLPGHPLAAIFMFDLIVYDWYLYKTNCQRRKPYFATMQENVSSNQGRETCLLVQLVEDNHEYLAYPLYSKSGNISSLQNAYGYVLIPRQKEGLKKGERVRIEVLR